MCGKEIDNRSARRAVVEGSLMVLCPDCYSKLSKHKQTSGVQRRTSTFTARDKSPRSAGTSRPPRGRVEEYEVVEDYALRIKTARERYGWSQEVLAQKVSESLNTIKRLESGKLKPSVELALKLERVLKIKLLEPVVEEQGVQLSRDKGGFLTIGDIIGIEGSSKKVQKGGT